MRRGLNGIDAAAEAAPDNDGKAFHVITLVSSLHLQRLCIGKFIVHFVRAKGSMHDANGLVSGSCVRIRSPLKQTSLLLLFYCWIRLICPWRV